MEVPFHLKTSLTHCIIINNLFYSTTCQTVILYKNSNFSTRIKLSTITPCNNYRETGKAVALKPWKIEYTIIWIQYYVIQQIVIINFRYQLNAHYFISITMLLYMFRATLRPSSGGPLHIYIIWFYVSLKLIYKI